MTAPAVTRAEAIVTRAITTIKAWARADRVTLRRAELLMLAADMDNVRQEILSLEGPPKRGHISKHARLLVCERAGWKCQGCGADLTAAGDRDIHIDHITPVARFGATRDDNLQLLCRDCNLRKGSKR